MAAQPTRTVILTRGLPGSGKSTWAQQWVAEFSGGQDSGGQDSVGRVRVNKDELRAMLHGSRYSPANERLVEAVRDAIVLTALADGRDVVVDDTNLARRHEQHMRRLVASFEVPVSVEIRDFTHVPIEVCIERDALRTRSVGEAVIRSMASRHRVVE